MTVDLRELRRSPLQEFRTEFDAAEVVGERAVRVREIPFRSMAGIRAEPGGSGYHRIGAVLGLTLPLACGHTARSNDSGQEHHSALWVGPDEWLIVSTDEPAALMDALTSELPHDLATVVELSANRCVVELSGPSARRVLEKGCPIDLHPSAFSAGNAISTNLGPVPLVLWQTGEATYRLLPRSSYAAYLARWLLDAMTEFSGPDFA